MHWWLPPTATPPELLWTLGAILALPVGLWVLSDAWGDLRSLQAPRARDLVLLAWRDLVIDGVVLYLLLLFAVIGLRAMSLPPAPGTSASDLGATLVGIGFILADAALGALAGYLAWVRHQVKRINRHLLDDSEAGIERRAAIRDLITAYQDGRLSAEDALDLIVGLRGQ